MENDVYCGIFFFELFTRNQVDLIIETITLDSDSRFSRLQE